MKQRNAKTPHPQRAAEVRTPSDGLRPWSAATHFIGLLLGVAALTMLVLLASQQGDPWKIVSFALYGASLMLLYGASTLYHVLPLSPRGRQVLRKVDHLMIFVLIAGTYTPICLVNMRGPWGWALFGVIWGLALLGMATKLCWFDCPRWISSTFYIAMGWMVLIAFYPLLTHMAIGGVLYLVLGGLLFTAGGVMYALKWPGRDNKYFGFHEWFHLLVMAGSFCHFWVMLHYVLPV
nr:hemolysin III family protein [Maliibacterium massiliense]